ncbi:MAG TPA: DUF490 domain-containing protein, partial [Thauera sp.]|nr:DUF490 domain-containing protein [Thauera sp.]
MTERRPDAADDALQESQPAPGVPRPRPRRWRRWLGWSVALPAVVLVGGSAWLLGTQSGLDVGLALAQRATGGALQVEGARGQVLGGLEVERIAYRTPDIHLELASVSLDWAPAALLRRQLHIKHLTVERIALAQAVAEDDADASPLVPPASLELPLAVAVDRLAVGAFALRDLPAAGDADSAVASAAEAIERAENAVADPAIAAEAVTEVAAEQGLIFSHLEAALDSDGRHHRLRTLTLDLPQGKANLRLALDGASPFALEGEGGFDGVIESRALGLRLKLGNNLLEPTLVANAEAEGLRARVEAAVASFAPNPLRRLVIRAGQFDPAAFVAGAPQAALSLEAELTSPADGAGLLAGPIRLTNGAPAAADANGIPLHSLAGVLDWRSGEIALDALEIRLPGQGRIAGRIAWRPPGAAVAGGRTAPDARTAPPPDVPASGGERPAQSATDIGFGQLVAALELAAIDTHQLDTRLPRQIVAGRVDAEADALRQQARIELDVGAARIEAEAVLRAAT